MVRPALLLLPVLGSATDQAQGEVVENIQYQFSPIGDYCLVLNYGAAALAEPARKLAGTGTETMADCAKKCTDDKDCKTWSYVEEPTGDHACWDLTQLNPEFPGSVPLVYDGTTAPVTGLYGTCSCPSTPSKTLTGDDFPAAEPSGYAEIFESSLHQPAPLMCWPKDDQGRLKKADAVVQRSNLVDKTSDKYFEGWCTGMTIHTLDGGDDCKAACERDPSCNGYQNVPDGSARPAGCFFGAGYDCDNANTWNGELADGADATTVAASADDGMKAERFTRGFVDVIATVKKWRIKGLTNRFDDAAFQVEAPAEAQGRRLETNWALLATRCKEVCYSDIWCSVWQVYDGTGTGTAGCWTEAQGSLGYPLGRSAEEVVAEEQGIYDGEFIQHWYSEDITTTTTTTTSPPPPNRLLPILLGLAGLAALLGLGAYAMGWCSPKEKVKKPRAKRALQPAPEPPKEEPKQEPVPTQPSFLMSAPVLTYTAAPVTYAAPVATMQAAPLTYAAPPVQASYQVVNPGQSVMVPQEPVVGGFMG